MRIYGLQKLTLLDYPEHLAALCFLGGCNFRCPFCQNGTLVLSPGDEPYLEPEEVLSFLHRRRGILDGVCISGGEPTLHADLPDFIREIKALGYLVKLDTNGTNPDMVAALLDEGLLDYVAMDIKSSPGGYLTVIGMAEQVSSGADPGLGSGSDEAAGAARAGFGSDGTVGAAGADSGNGEAAGAAHAGFGSGPSAASQAAPLLATLQRTIDLLMAKAPDYEFRTTAVKGLHTAGDFAAIGQWLRGARRYFIQSYRDADTTVGRLEGMLFPRLGSFTPEECREFLAIVKEYIPAAQLRGIE